MMSATARTLRTANVFLQVARVRPAVCHWSSSSKTSKSGEDKNPYNLGTTGMKPSVQSLDASTDCPERKAYIHKEPEPLDHKIKKPPFDKFLASMKSDNKHYHAEELYTYHTWSFYDIERELSSHRIPQPSSRKPKTQ